MEWLQVSLLFLAIAGLIIWFYIKSRNDWRHNAEIYRIAENDIKKTLEKMKKREK